MNHDYKYEGMSEEHRNALIPALGHKEQREERARARQAAQGHTPGPWHVGTRYDIVTEGRARCICKVYHLRSQNAPDGEEPNANARLIAAAPDLLAACKAFEGYYDGASDSSTRGMSEAYGIARAAIRAAEGH